MAQQHTVAGTGLCFDKLGLGLAWLVPRESRRVYYADNELPCWEESSRNYKVMLLAGLMIFGQGYIALAVPEGAGSFY